MFQRLERSSHSIIFYLIFKAHTKNAKTVKMLKKDISFTKSLEARLLHTEVIFIDHVM